MAHKPDWIGLPLLDWISEAVATPTSSPQTMACAPLCWSIRHWKRGEATLVLNIGNRPSRRVVALGELCQLVKEANTLSHERFGNLNILLPVVEARGVCRRYFTQDCRCQDRGELGNELDSGVH